MREAHHGYVGSTENCWQGCCVVENPIILFDGICNLCANSVQFVARRDHDECFRFASLQSDVATRLLQQHHYTQDKLSSVLLITDGRLYEKSAAAMQIAKRLDAPWPIFYYLFLWIPAFLVDPIYDFIGNRRYKWFGSKESCWVPTDDLSDRFLE